MITPCSPPQVADIKQTQRLKQMEEEDHQKRISNTRRTIDDLKAELAKVADQPDMTPRINAVNVELRNIREERAKTEGEKADLRREKDNLYAESTRESFPHAMQHPSGLENCHFKAWKSPWGKKCNPKRFGKVMKCCYIHMFIQFD